MGSARDRFRASVGRRRLSNPARFAKRCHSGWRRMPSLKSRPSKPEQRKMSRTSGPQAKEFPFGQLGKDVTASKRKFCRPFSLQAPQRPKDVTVFPSVILKICHGYLPRRTQQFDPGIAKDVTATGAPRLPRPAQHIGQSCHSHDAGRQARTFRINESGALKMSRRPPRIGVRSGFSQSAMLRSG
jgi:hypothetical protein